MEGLPVQKLLDIFEDCEEVVFYEIEEFRVLNPKPLLEKGIDHGIEDIKGNITRVG